MKGLQQTEHEQITSQARHLKTEYSELLSEIEFTESVCADENPHLVHFADELIVQASYTSDLGAGLTLLMREVGKIADRLNKGRRSPGQTAQDLFRLAERLDGYAVDSFDTANELLGITRQLIDIPEGS